MAAGAALGAWLGNDKGAQAQIKQNISNVVITKNDVKNITENTNRVLIDSINKAIQNVRQGTLASQTIAITGLECEGDLIADGINQNMNVKADITAIQDNKVANTIKTDLLDKMETDTKNLTDNNIGTRLTAAVTATASQGLFAPTPPPANASVDQDIKTQIDTVNKTYNDFKNDNTTKLTLGNKTIQEVVNSMNLAQNIIIANDKAKACILKNIKQDMTAENFLKEAQKTVDMNDVITKIANKADFKVTDDTKNTVKVDAEATATATTKSVGIEGLFNSSCIIVIIIIIVIIGGGGFLIYKTVPEVNWQLILVVGIIILVVISIVWSSINSSSSKKTAANDQVVNSYTCQNMLPLLQQAAGQDNSKAVNALKNYDTSKLTQAQLDQSTNNLKNHSYNTEDQFNESKNYFNNTLGCAPKFTADFKKFT